MMRITYCGNKSTLCVSVDDVLRELYKVLNDGIFKMSSISCIMIVQVFKFLSFRTCIICWDLMDCTNKETFYTSQSGVTNDLI